MGGNIGYLDSSVRSEALPMGQGAGPKEGTKEYFDEIFKKDRKKYFSAGVQQQIFKAAQAGTYDHQAGLSAG